MRQRSGSQALLIIDGRWQLSHLIRSSQYQLKIELKLVILAAETWLKLPIFPPARGFVKKCFNEKCFNEDFPKIA